MNSELPLILSQIRPDSDVTSHSDEIITDEDYVTPGHSLNMTMSQQGNSDSQSNCNSKLSDRDTPLSPLSCTIWGGEESRDKYLPEKGYFTRQLPPELSSGYIRDLVMNHAMRSLYPCNSVVRRCSVGGEGGGEGREILLLFKCPLSGSVYDLGAVSRRHSGSGEPTAWQIHTLL